MATLSCRFMERKLYPGVDFIKPPSLSIWNHKKIALGKFYLKNIAVSGMNASVFRDNLRFGLLDSGFVVSKVKEKEPAGGGVRSDDPPKKKEAEKDIKDRLEINPLSIAAICGEYGSDLYINGYIVETKTGDLLDEKVSVMVNLFVYRSDGKLAVYMRYIGSESMDSNEMNAEIGLRFAQRLRTLVGQKPAAKKR